MSSSYFHTFVAVYKNRPLSTKHNTHENRFRLQFYARLRADKCLRRQVTLRMPKERAAVMVINPEHVTSDGEDCTYFIDEKPVLFARGMKHLLDRVPLADATVIKRQMIAYFGKTIYYRCCNKERLIKPKEQKYIQELFRKRGVTETPQYDEYIEYYDLG